MSKEKLIQWVYLNTLLDSLPSILYVNRTTICVKVSLTNG